MASVRRNETIELTFEAEVQVANPMREIEFNVAFREAGGTEVVLPGFWDGGSTWKARFAWPRDSEWQWTASSSPEDAGLHGRTGAFSVQGTDDSTGLSIRGPICIADDGRHFAHASGTPFNWLGDTWWMGLSRRLPLEGLEFLIEDRVAKGFTVIQIIAGLYPDMHWYDERGMGDGGYPWDQDFNSINPAYFREMDRRIGMLVNAGLSPCIVGFWGYFMDFAGPDVLRHHWRNLVARYASLPVTWCVAGEGLMPFYVDAHRIEDMDEWRRTRSAAWSAMATWIRSQDGFQRPVTIHPTDFGRQQVDDPSTINFEMLQTGHQGFPALSNTINMLESSLAKQPEMPIIISEVNYEGILESSGPDIQRFLYWSSALSGSAGFTYGANGLWQVNSDEMPYGASPHGMAWGGPSWRDASQLGGSGQIGLAKQFLDTLDWPSLTPSPHLVSDHASEEDRILPYAAVASDGTRIVFIPAPAIFLLRRGGLQLLELEPGSRREGFYLNPKSGEELEAVDIVAEPDGTSFMPTPPIIQDWVFVLRP